MEKEEFPKPDSDGRGARTDESTECSNSEMKVARSGTTDLTLTSSHFKTLPDLANWWTSISDSIQRADDPSPFFLANAPWLQEFRTIMRNILQSRNIGDQERQLAITLASTMTSTVGTSWLGNDSKFLQLLTSLAAIDVRMILDHDTMVEAGASSGTDAEYITRCCELLETAMNCAASVEDGLVGGEGGVVLNENQALQINGTLLELTKFVLQYFAVMNERNIPMPNCVSYPLYRLVCSYLAQGLALVGPNNLMAAAKPLLTLNREIISELNKEQSSSDYFDCTALLLPALYQLIEMGTEWDCVKKAFRDEGALSLMDLYFKQESITVSEYDQEILKLWKDL